MFAMSAVDGQSDIENVLPVGGGRGREGRGSDSSASKFLKKKDSAFVSGNKSETKDPFIKEVNKHILKGCNKILGFLGAKSKLEIAEPDFEELEIPQKYRPRDFQSTCQATGFSPASLRRLYRGFKTECPSGLMTEEAFREVFAKFFPNGATCSAYSHYVFSSMDPEDKGVVSFEEFAQALSLLKRGSLEDKLVWTFHLYDLNGDGVLSRDEIKDVTTSIYSLVGDKETGAPPSREVINTRVEMVAKKFGLPADPLVGGITLEQFLAVCLKDVEIYQALLVMGDGG